MPDDNKFGGEVGSSLYEEEPTLPAISKQAPRTRRVSVRLSESIFERLEAATASPGVGKSLVVEAALERFLDPAPPIEGIVHEALDRIASQIAHLKSDVAIIAETVALHARYHLTVMPPMPKSRQREASILGHARFKSLVEQVARRLRHGRPLLRETIENLSQNPGAAGVKSGGQTMLGPAAADRNGLAVATKNTDFDMTAAVQEDGSNRNFLRLPNAFC